MDNGAASYWINKDKVKEWVYEHFDPSAKILDVGAGSGTYWNLLHEKYKNIDAVEIYAPNIKDYELEKKYANVYNNDIVTFEYGSYDLIIFGDVIEHLTIPNAQKVIKYAFNRCRNLIVAIPYNYPQGPNENKWEEHIQSDLTQQNVLERYPLLKPLFIDERYGYYIKVL